MPARPTPPHVTAWFHEYHDQLLRFLRRGLDDPAEAQDLAQEVFLRLLRIDEPDLIQHPRAYLYRVAINVIQEWRMRNQRFPLQDGQDLEQIPDHHEPAADLEADEQAARVNAAVARLPALYRAVLKLRVTQGMTHNEVAAQLGLSPRMVKRYLIKAYARLRDLLGDAAGGPRP